MIENVADILELLIKATMQDDGGLQKLDEAVRRIGANSGLTGQALSNLQSRVSAEFQKMTAAGLNFKQQIDALSKSAGIFKSLLPDPKAVREASIANQIAFNQYISPPTLNRSLSASGGFEQVSDKYGLPSASSYTSVVESQPYKYLSPIKTPGSLYQNWLYQSGIVTEPYSAPPNIPTYENPTGHAASSPIVQHFHITAMDAQSFLDARTKISSAVMQSVVEGHPVGNALQRAILGA